MPFELCMFEVHRTLELYTEAEQMLLLVQMSSYLFLARQRKNEIDASTRFVRQIRAALDRR